MKIRTHKAESLNTQRKQVVAKKWSSIHPKKFQTNEIEGEQKIETALGTHSSRKSNFKSKLKRKKGTQEEIVFALRNTMVQNKNDNFTLKNHSSLLNVPNNACRAANMFGFAAMQSTCNESGTVSKGAKKNSPPSDFSLRTLRLAVSKSLNCKQVTENETPENLHSCNFCEKNDQYQCELKKYLQMKLYSLTTESTPTKERSDYDTKSSAKRSTNIVQSTSKVYSQQKDYSQFKNNVCQKSTPNRLKSNFDVKRSVETFSLLRSTSKIYNQQKVVVQAKKNVCQQCYSSFPNKRHLERHSCVNSFLKKFTKGEYLCFVCGIRFMWLNELILHEKSHELLSVQPPPDSAVQSTRHLLNWIRRLEEKRYVETISPHWCSACNKNYYNSKTSHDLLYSQMRPFQCPFCSERFSELSFLLLHTKLHEIAANF